ncbi:formate/nitrite transporter family protein [Micromonospora sp. NPDC000442]|uniref:formate/nitrite transporter family protein n=1 Tax=Micromonospora sp. NPDC000442 TaxID=3364217 RepID=UPI0036ACC56A
MRGDRGTGSEPEVARAFDRVVEEGAVRLARPWIPLVVTGVLGGIDVGTGALAYLLVEQATGQPLLAGLAFGIGFVALLLARSELFTENFLVPVTAVAAGRNTPGSLLRLWSVTLVGNLLGGWLLAWLIIRAFPGLHDTAIGTGTTTPPSASTCAPSPWPCSPAW